jgi:hypothetical protein
MAFGSAYWEKEDADLWILMQDARIQGGYVNIIDLTVR